VYMRYSGQGWEIPITITAEQAKAPQEAVFLHRFEQEYSALFGRTVEGMDVEITVWSVNATTPSDSVTVLDLAHDQGQADVAGQRAMFDAALGQFCTTAVVLRETMQTGQTVHGPAAITEDETTIIIPASRKAIRQADGCIDVTVAQEKQ